MADCATAGSESSSRIFPASAAAHTAVDASTGDFKLMSHFLLLAQRFHKFLQRVETCVESVRRLVVFGTALNLPRGLGGGEGGLVGWVVVEPLMFAGSALAPS